MVAATAAVMDTATMGIMGAAATDMAAIVAKRETQEETRGCAVWRGLFVLTCSL